jgi:hypothetical protein
MLLVVAHCRHIRVAPLHGRVVRRAVTGSGGGRHPDVPHAGVAPGRGDGGVTCPGVRPAALARVLHRRFGSFGFVERLPRPSLVTFGGRRHDL